MRRPLCILLILNVGFIVDHFTDAKPATYASDAIAEAEATRKGGFKRDKTAITYPDEVFRDSYGNPVTPYTTLSTADPRFSTRAIGTTKSGAVTTRIGSNANGPRGVIKFQLPSYAGGITQIIGPYKEPTGKPATNVQLPISDLLPPLEAVPAETPTNQEEVDQNGAQITPSIENEIPDSSPTSNKISDADRNVTDAPTTSTTSGPLSSTSAIIDLLPSLIRDVGQLSSTENHKEITSTTETTVSLPEEITSESTPTTTEGAVASTTTADAKTTKEPSEDAAHVALPLSELLPPPVKTANTESPADKVSPSSTTRKPVTESRLGESAEKETPVQKLESELAPSVASSSTRGPSSQANSPTEKPTTKNIFDFKGAAGILGNTNKRGYAVREDGTIDSDATPNKPASVKNKIQSASLPPSQSSPNEESEIALRSGNGEETKTDSASPEITTEAITKKPIQKYTGGFHGAPGILGDSNKRGYAINDDGSVDYNRTPSSPASSAPRIDATTVTTPKENPLQSELLPPWHSDPVHEPTIEVSSQTPEKANSQSPAPVTTKAPEAATKKPIQKYTGGFHGAPGILGGSNKRGYAIKEDGSVDYNRTPSSPDTSAPRIGSPTGIPPKTSPLQSDLLPALHSDTAREPTIEVSSQSPAPVPVTTNAPEATTTKPVQKYTGGFHGAPGILGDSNKRGFAIRDDGSIDYNRTPSSPASAAPRIDASTETAPKVNPLQSELLPPLPADTVREPTIETRSPKPDEAKPQSPAPVTAKIPGATTKKPIQKYTGGFHGAPGILGDTNKRGFAIRDDGSIDYDRTPPSPASSAPRVDASTETVLTTPSRPSIAPSTNKVDTIAPTRAPTQSPHTTKKSLSSFDTTSGQAWRTTRPTATSAQPPQFNAFGNNFRDQSNRFPQFNSFGVGSSSSAGPQGTFTSQSHYNFDSNHPNVNGFHFGQQFVPNQAQNPALNSNKVPSQSGSANPLNNSAATQNQAQNTNVNSQDANATPGNANGPVQRPNYSQNPFLNPNANNASPQNGNTQDGSAALGNVNGATQSPSNTPSSPQDASNLNNGNVNSQASTASPADQQKVPNLNDRLGSNAPPSASSPSAPNDNSGSAQSDAAKSDDQAAGNLNDKPYTGIFGGSGAHTAGADTGNRPTSLNDQQNDNSAQEGSASNGQTNGQNGNAGATGNDLNKQNQSPSPVPPTQPSTQTPSSSTASPPSTSTTIASSPSLPQNTFMQPRPFSQPTQFNQRYNPYANNPFFNPQPFPGFAAPNMNAGIDQTNINPSAQTPVPNGSSANQDQSQNQNQSPQTASNSGNSNGASVPQPVTGLIAPIESQNPVPTGDAPAYGTNPFLNQPSLQPFLPPIFSPNTQAPFQYNNNNPFLVPNSQFIAASPSEANASPATASTNDRFGNGNSATQNAAQNGVGASQVPQQPGFQSGNYRPQSFPFQSFPSFQPFPGFQQFQQFQQPNLSPFLPPSQFAVQNVPTVNRFGSAPITSNNANANQKVSNKYTGGFGGPPGILSPYDRKGRK